MGHGLFAGEKRTLYSNIPRVSCIVVFVMSPLHQTNHAMPTALAQAVQRVRLG